MEMVAALELLGRYTAEQWGLVTTPQARVVGVDAVTLHRLKEAGFLHPVRRGIYASAWSAASAARGEQTAWLGLRPTVPGWERPKLDPDGGVVSHSSALRLHDLGDLAHDRVELTVPRRRTSRDPDVRLHQAALTEDQVTVIDGLPVTTVLRTIRDLLEQRVDASHVATVIRQAVEAGKVQLDELAERLGPHAHRYGVHPADGQALLDYLLDHIGLSISVLSTRRSPITWATLRDGDLAWEELAGKAVTWGDLARLSEPELSRLLPKDKP